MMSIAHEPVGPSLDAESRAWVERLSVAGPTRRRAVAELYDRLRRHAAFHIRARVMTIPAFPRSDIDDLAAQAAGDALVAVLRKLDDYRGDSRFWTWASRFAEIEASVSIRRRLGRDRVGISRRPEVVDEVVDLRRSVHDRAELRETLAAVATVVNSALTPRERAVLTAIAMDGRTAASVAERLEMTPGAVYKCLHDARLKLRSHAAGSGVAGRGLADPPGTVQPSKSGWRERAL